jgi:hypothetical protein
MRRHTAGHSGVLLNFDCQKYDATKHAKIGGKRQPLIYNGMLHATIPIFSNQGQERTANINESLQSLSSCPLWLI